MRIRLIVVTSMLAIQAPHAMSGLSVSQTQTVELKVVESRRNELFPASRDYVAALINDGTGSASIEAVQMPGGYAGSGRFYPCSLQFWMRSKHKWVTRRPAKLSSFGKKPRVIEIEIKPGERLEVCNSLLPQQQGRAGDSVRFALSLQWGHEPSVFSKAFKIGGEGASKEH